MMAGLGWAFIGIAQVVVEGSSHAMDESILLSMRSAGDLSDPIGPGWVEEMGRDFTALGGVAVLTLLTVMSTVYLFLTGKRRNALLLAAAVGTGIVLSMLLKTGFDRPRPALVPHGSIVYTKSFPSGHSMMAAVTYLTLGALLMRAHARRSTRAFIVGFAVLITLLVGVSRVYLGVHWPTDVLAGWAAGGLWASSAWMVARWLQREGQVEQPHERKDEMVASPGAA